MNARRGFTLVEVAVTIVIVGIGLLSLLQGLNEAKLTAAHTRNLKLSRELALYTLGQIEAGQFQEDIEAGLKGSYAEQGYPDFTYEVIVGDESFSEELEGGAFDSWAPRDEDDGTDEEDEEAEEPFEKVKIRITFPQLHEFKSELVLERWMPWKQVYGEQEEDGSTTSSAADSEGTAGSSGTGSGGNK
jgi:prepilin-type N-terminal cleavage/methylation domain-containing protein